MLVSQCIRRTPHNDESFLPDGVTVCSVMFVTTVLYMCVMRYVWNQHWILVLLFGIFIIIDLYFLAANAIKFLEGSLYSHKNLATQHLFS